MFKAEAKAKLKDKYIEKRSKPKTRRTIRPQLDFIPTQTEVLEMTGRDKYGNPTIIPHQIQFMDSMPELPEQLIPEPKAPKPKKEPKKEPTKAFGDIPALPSRLF